MTFPCSVHGRTSHIQSCPVLFPAISVGAKRHQENEAAPGSKQRHSNFLDCKEVCICHHCIYQLAMQMGCDYFHAQLSHLHLQAQHLHTGMEPCAGVVCLGPDTRTVSL